MLPKHSGLLGSLSSKATDLSCGWWLHGLVVVTVLSVSACSFDAGPLTQRQCTTQRDCGAGQVCFNGYCVVGQGEEDVDLPDVPDVEEDMGDPCIDDDNDEFFVGPLCERRPVDCNDRDSTINPDADEICDGVDNDCDSTMDEGTAVACPLQMGVCAGAMRQCLGAAGLEDEDDCDYGADYEVEEEYCTGAMIDTANLCLDDAVNMTIARAEQILCDGLDNDCDNAVDETVGVPCYVTGDPRPEVEQPGAVCTVGMRVCNGDTLAACDGAVGPGDDDTPATRCNGVNDDCDADGVDENCTCEMDETRDCYEGPNLTEDVGRCVGGTATCAGGVFGPCEGQVLPRLETCDNIGMDDDCDGNTDDISEGIQYGGACIRPDLDGECENGVLMCDVEDDTGTFGCQQVVFPEAETCGNRNEDNDCDTDTQDIDFPSNPSPEPPRLGGDCIAESAFGVCRDGEWSCSGTEEEPFCLPGDAAGSITQCDDVDEDCDGDSDEYMVGTEEFCGDCDTACDTGAGEVCCPTSEVCRTVGNCP